MCCMLSHEHIARIGSHFSHGNQHGRLRSATEEIRGGHEPFARCDYHKSGVSAARCWKRLSDRRLDACTSRAEWTGELVDRCIVAPDFHITVCNGGWQYNGELWAAGWIYSSVSCVDPYLEGADDHAHCHLRAIVDPRIYLMKVPWWNMALARLWFAEAPRAVGEFSFLNRHVHA